MSDAVTIDLTTLTDDQFATLREQVDEETYRRHVLSTAAEEIADIIRNYVNAGGDKENLADELTDVLASDS